MHGYGKVLLASLFASGSLALPWAQPPMDANSGTPPANTQNTGPPNTESTSSGGETPPVISDVGPAYSLLLAKETSPTDHDGVIVAWAFGNPFCTQRQLLSDDIEDFCKKNLTFDRVPKLNENLEPTGEVTRISGHFTGCSDDVSLGRSYAGLYWVEVVGMYDGVGDQPAAPGGAEGTVPRTPKTNSPPTSNTQPNTNSGTPPTSNTQSNTNSGTPPTTKNTETTTGGPVDGPASGETYYLCNNDREAHECPLSSKDEVDIVVFASCGQYAYTKGFPAPGGNAGGATTTTPPPDNNPPQGVNQ